MIGRPVADGVLDRPAPNRFGAGLLALVPWAVATAVVVGGVAAAAPLALWVGAGLLAGLSLSGSI